MKDNLKNIEWLSGILKISKQYKELCDNYGCTGLWNDSDVYTIKSKLKILKEEIQNSPTLVNPELPRLV